MKPVVRPATPGDADAIAAIYAHHVLHGTGTFDEVPPDAEYFTARIADITARGWPWLVAEIAGSAAGYAYLTQFRDRAAYRFSGESSIYVDQARVGQGIGSLLLEALLVEAVACGFRQMFAVVGDSANLPSIKLHERHGFVRVGLLRDAGIKFGRPLDVVYLQRTLT